jgi:hypothetical protein
MAVTSKGLGLSIPTYPHSCLPHPPWPLRRVLSQAVSVDPLRSRPWWSMRIVRFLSFAWAGRKTGSAGTDYPLALHHYFRRKVARMFMFELIFQSHSWAYSELPSAWPWSIRSVVRRDFKSNDLNSGSGITLVLVKSSPRALAGNFAFPGDSR